MTSTVPYLLKLMLHKRKPTHNVCCFPSKCIVRDHQGSPWGQKESFKPIKNFWPRFPPEPLEGPGGPDTVRDHHPEVKKNPLRKGDKWRPPTRARTFGARHLALWTFGARTIGALDNWHPGHFAPGHLAVGTIGAQEILHRDNWCPGNFPPRHLALKDNSLWTIIITKIKYDFSIYRTSETVSSILHKNIGWGIKSLNF